MEVVDESANEERCALTYVNERLDIPVGGHWVPLFADT